MPRQTRPNSVGPEAGTSKEKPFRVLLVDHEPQAHAVLGEVIQGQHMVLIQATSIAEAQRRLIEAPVDLALIEPNLPDGSGMTLAGEIKRQRPITQTIVITGQPSMERAVEALRIGAGDFIVKPLDLNDLSDRVRRALDRHKSERRKMRRLRRLRRVCRKLNQAHDEVSQQVDVLCNDLVTAYQELATQIHQVSETGSFTDSLRRELDLEQILRKTLEHLLEKAGPTNAAIFLPATADEYTLGGYVNYDCSGTAANLLLEHMADAVAPVIAEHDNVVSLSDEQTLADWFGRDWNSLTESHLLAVSCRHDGEVLAVLVLFRDQAEPFDDSLAAHLEAIGPILGDYLAKVIRVHHRHIPGLNSADNDGDALAGF